jgi:hypothetical protein
MLTLGDSQGNRELLKREQATLPFTFKGKSFKTWTLARQEAAPRALYFSSLYPLKGMGIRPDFFIPHSLFPVKVFPFLVNLTMRDF